jgi:hypothetical protein
MWKIKESTPCKEETGVCQIAYALFFFNRRTDCLSNVPVNRRKHIPALFREVWFLGIPEGALPEKRPASLYGRRRLLWSALFLSVSLLCQVVLYPQMIFVII